MNLRSDARPPRTTTATPTARPDPGARTDGDHDHNGDDDRDHDREDAAAAVALAHELLVAAHALEPPAGRRRAARMARLVGDDDAMASTLVLTDQVARIRDPHRAARRLRSLVAAHGAPTFLGPLDRAALRAGAALGAVLPATVARVMAWRLRRESRGIVLPAEDPPFARHLARRRAEHVDLNINVLGEAILGDDEAARRRDEVIERIRRPDVDYVSVKVSAVCAQVSSLAFDRSVERIVERLRPILAAAATCTPPVFVNLDMEEHRDLELTLTVFMRLLDEPGLTGLDAGIVLQAYLPDAHRAFEQLAPWAVERHHRAGARTRVRLVKGANLAMERVEAELHGWPQAPYGSKAEVDASYKRLLDRALDPCWGDAVRVGVASHNLFDVAWALTRAARLGSDARLDLEMLEGMAPGEAEAVRRRRGSIRLYAPVVHRSEHDAAIAYLVRRLDENTSPENFLGHPFDLDGDPEWDAQRDRFLAAVADRHDVSTSPRRRQDRSAEAASPSSAAPPLDAPFANEPDTDWSRPANREWLRRALADRSTIVERVPLVIGGHHRWNEGRTATGIDPSHPERPCYRYALASAADVDDAVAVAVAAQRTWGATTGHHRGELLLQVADVLARHRGEAIAVMALDAGKVVAQSDPEVSEAVDFARWYAHRAPELDDHRAGHRPLGPVVITPPWNFPFAIPAGGILAALAAGSTVIVKPAPETVLTAWWLCRWLWEAGVPADVVQFVPCPDDEVGRALVTHAQVGAVVLTGSADTARLFLDWKPELRLHAETSGKNAMVVTAAADLDLAVRDVVASAFGHAGQKCSAVSLAIVEQSVIDDGRFLAQLADATRTLRVGPADDPSVDVGPLIAPPSASLRRALTTLAPGESWLVEPRPLDRAGHRWSPGIVVGVRPGSFLHRTECFGPVLAVMAATDLDDAIQLQNATTFGLTGGLHSLDPDEIERWLGAVEVGNAYVNRTTTGAIVGRQPFGGWKRSAVGPAAKAGGPDYVASLCHWADPDGPAAERVAERVERATASYAQCWAALAAPTDVIGLVAERNEHRHVPLATVVLRVEADADATDVELCRRAAATVGTTLVVSHAGDESVDELRTRWPAARPDRLRVLGSAPEALRRAAHDAWLPLDDRRPVADGELELPRWCREQSVSATAHRHGNTRAT